jgi:hypothetical protein
MNRRALAGLVRGVGRGCLKVAERSSA